MTDVLPSFSEIIERALESRMASVHVGMPGEVVSYDVVRQTATIKPCLRRVMFDDDGEQVEEELPPIENVPVIWPGGSGLTMHGTLAAGDTGDLTFSSQSHNEWQATGRVSTPGDLKLHNLGAAKFYPGLRHSKNAAPDSDNSIGIPGGLRAHFEADAVSIGSGGQAVALSTALASALDSAATAAIGAAVPNDGGKAAFAAFKSTLGSASYGAGSLKADP